jgi:hypothetical protein
VCACARARKKKGACGQKKKRKKQKKNIEMRRLRPQKITKKNSYSDVSGMRADV